MTTDPIFDIDYSKDGSEIWKKIEMRIEILRKIHKEKSDFDLKNMFVTIQLFPYLVEKNEAGRNDIVGQIDLEIKKDKEYYSQNSQRLTPPAGFYYANETKTCIDIQINESGGKIRFINGQFYVIAVTKLLVKKTKEGKDVKEHHIRTMAGKENYECKFESSYFKYINALKCEDLHNFTSRQAKEAVIQIFAESSRSELVRKAFERLFREETLFPDEVVVGLGLVYTNYDAIFKASGRVNTNIHSNAAWTPLTMEEHVPWYNNLKNDNEKSAIKALTNYARGK